MGQFVAQQGLAGGRSEIQLAGGKGDAVALGHGFGAGIGHGLALIELDGRQVRLEGVLHFLADGVGQVYLVAQHLLGRRRSAGPQRLHGGGGWRNFFRLRNSCFCPLAGGILIRHG